MNTDPISDMLTRIRNGLAVGKQEVLLPHSKYKQSLADFLVKTGWLLAVEIVEDEKFKMLKLRLKYKPSGMTVINGLKRVSMPGQRIYSNSGNIPRVKYGVGTTVVSTSRGLMTDKDARKAKVGGEIVCQIW